MKSKIVLLLVAALVAGTTSAFASGKLKTSTFKVYGNCGMCENRIEQAAKGVKGVKSAEWDKKSMMMSVAYDASKTGAEAINSAVAKAGHDTETHATSDATYEQLHNCCRYKRAETKQTGGSDNMPAGECPQSTKKAGCCG